MKKLERFVPAYKRRRQFKAELARLTFTRMRTDFEPFLRSRALNAIAEMCGLPRKEP